MENYRVISELNEQQISELTDLYKNEFWSHNRTQHEVAKMLAADVEAELWRLRLDNWRILYAIDESQGIVDVLAVRKRPPYDYGDLEELLEDLYQFPF